jgi:hypothetical protein
MYYQNTILMYILIVLQDKKPIQIELHKCKEMYWSAAGNEGTGYGIGVFDTGCAGTGCVLAF